MTDITEQLAERTRLLHVAEDKIEKLRAEIDDLRARVAMLESDENEGTAITAMPIQIGDDLCYLPVNAHGIVKRALMECAEYLIYITAKGPHK